MMALVWIACFVAAVTASTVLIRVGIPSLKAFARSAPGAEEKQRPEPLPDSRGGIFDLASVGFWIGVFEALIIFLFINLEAPTGLGIILAAKGLARKEEMHADPSYYLLGFLINISISLGFAVLALRLVEWLSAL